MGNPKGAIEPYQPGVYRDDPDRDDAASTSSAMLMGDIDYPEEQLPAYSDDPNPVNSQALPASHQDPNVIRLPPTLPVSSESSDQLEVRSLCPAFSSSDGALEDMLREQALYPPRYYVELFGTHTETRRQSGKEKKERVTDFHIKIDITNTLSKNPGQQGGFNYTHSLEGFEKGYRGGILKSLTPTLTPEELEESGTNQIGAWCHKFINDNSSTKCFTLTRKIVNHDTATLERLLRSLIASTNYRGHLSVTFPKTHARLTVYSPSKLNTWRLNNYIRWFFYLTFLWIFAWPVLFFTTKRYEVISAVFPYANAAPQDAAEGRAIERVPLVMSEHAWFQRWEKAIRKGVLSRFVYKNDVLMDEEYRRIAEQEPDRRDASGQVNVPRTGNAFADGALNLLAGGLQLAQDVTGTRGWGYDS
ncbi:hypothetical protein B7463_g7588, partial [Scytalidium lignicola]